RTSAIAVHQRCDLERACTTRCRAMRSWHAGCDRAGSADLPGSALEKVCGLNGSREDARMLRFWRDGILKSQRGFIGASSEVAANAAAETSGLLAEALEHAPIDGEMWSRVGALLVRQGETTRGAAAFRIALRLDPNHSEAHRQLARVLAAHGSSAEAAAHYERFLDLTDKSRQDARTQ